MRKIFGESYRSDVQLTDKTEGCVFILGFCVDDIEWDGE